MTLQLWLLIGGMWLIVAAVLAPGIGARLKRSADAQSIPVEDGPPEWEPDDSEAQRIAEQFAEAAAEEDRTHD